MLLFADNERLSKAKKKKKKFIEKTTNCTFLTRISLTSKFLWVTSLHHLCWITRHMPFSSLRVLDFHPRLLRADAMQSLSSDPLQHCFSMHLRSIRN